MASDIDVYLLDTCALVWWTLAAENLSASASRACRAVLDSGGYVSSISVWEIGLKIRRGRFDFPIRLSEYLRRLARLECLEILPVDLDTWVKNLDLDWSHRDPADRTIVATAMLRGLQIVTSDARIRRFYPHCIW